MKKLKTDYTKEDMLYWLNRLDQNIRIYADCFNDIQNTDDFKILEYTLKLKQACENLEIIKN